MHNLLPDRVKDKRQREARSNADMYTIILNLRLIDLRIVLQARFPLKHFTAAGEKSRQINIFFYSFAAGEIIPAIPVVENAQLLLKEQLTTAKEQLQPSFAKFFASGGEMLERKTGFSVCHKFL